MHFNIVTTTFLTPLITTFFILSFLPTQLEIYTFILFPSLSPVCVAQPVFRMEPVLLYGPLTGAISSKKTKSPSNCSYQTTIVSHLVMGFCAHILSIWWDFVCSLTDLLYLCGFLCVSTLMCLESFVSLILSTMPSLTIFWPLLFLKDHWTSGREVWYAYSI